MQHSFDTRIAWAVLALSFCSLAFQFGAPGHAQMSALMIKVQALLRTRHHASSVSCSLAEVAR